MRCTLCPAPFRVPVFLSAFIAVAVPNLCLADAAATYDPDTYDLASGDALEITVFRIPELSREVTVGFDGKVAFPPLGRIAVDGLDLDEVSDLIRGQLAEAGVIVDAQVTVDLTAARDVFIGGDVRTPGAFAYRPGLSVRHAIVLAGGLGAGQAVTPAQSMAVMAQRNVLLVERARVDAQILRVRSELAQADRLLGGKEAPVGYQKVEEINLLANLDEDSAQKAHVSERVALVAEQLATLEDQRAQQQRVLKAQSDNLTRIQDIHSRGLTVDSRVQQEQRAYETMQERLADTTTRIAATRQQLAEATHERDRFDARREDRLHDELAALLFRWDEISAQIAGVTRQLAAMGIAQTDSYRIELRRFEKGVATRVAAEPGHAVASRGHVGGADRGQRQRHAS